MFSFSFVDKAVRSENEDCRLSRSDSNSNSSMGMTRRMF